MSKTKDDLMKRGEVFPPVSDSDYDKTQALIETLKGEMREKGTLLDPRFTGDEHFRISCICLFEAFTHESWDLVWRVALPTVRYYYNSIHGYQEGGLAIDVSFKGKTLQHALKGAIAYVREIKTLGFEFYKKDEIKTKEVDE